MFGTRFYALLGFVIACGVVVLLGKPDPIVSFDSARQLWSDVLRDSDDLGLQITRVPAYQEMQLGDHLAAQVGTWRREDPEAERYVAAVGAQLVPGVHRNTIRYRFHVLRSPVMNAFALPGGHVYVMTGMLDLLQSEAELAAVLGHEMSHVDLRHCIEQYQYQLALKKTRAGDVAPIAELAHLVVAIGYRQDQELEADLAGQRLAVEAGYNPEAAATVFRRLQETLGEPARPPASTPAGEFSQALDQALGSHFQTHPPSAERARQLSALAARERRQLAGKIVYSGIRNYREKISRTERVYVEEQHVE